MPRTSTPGAIEAAVSTRSGAPSTPASSSSRPAAARRRRPTRDGRIARRSEASRRMRRARLHARTSPTVGGIGPSRRSRAAADAARPAPTTATCSRSGSRRRPGVRLPARSGDARAASGGRRLLVRAAPTRSSAGSTLPTRVWLPTAPIGARSTRSSASPVRHASWNGNLSRSLRRRTPSSRGTEASSSCDPAGAATRSPPGDYAGSSSPPDAGDSRCGRQAASIVSRAAPRALNSASQATARRPIQTGVRTT